MDIWSIGCIFAEMTMLRPLFPGDSEIDELLGIFRLLGTPDEDLWPCVALLRDYQAAFPTWAPKPLGEVITVMDAWTSLPRPWSMSPAACSQPRLPCTHATSMIWTRRLSLETLDAAGAHGSACRVAGLSRRGVG